MISTELYIHGHMLSNESEMIETIYKKNNTLRFVSSWYHPISGVGALHKKLYNLGYKLGIHRVNSLSK